jgi:hydroxyethylthiazole kinase-like uncharacterized protein yjeF
MNALFRTRELRALETRALASLPTGTLMQRAGAAAAALIDREWSLHFTMREDAGVGSAGAARDRAVLVLCGPGNNGGDGFACARALQEKGYRCVCWAPLPSATAEARSQRQRWEELPGTTLVDAPGDLDFHLAVDAVLGIGAARPLDGPLLDALRWTRERRLPVVALDVPSGIDADTGQWLGAIAGAPAQCTVSFLRDKPGLHLRDALAARGRLHIETLGVAADPLDPPIPGRMNDPEEFRCLLVRRPPDVNKGSYGTVAVAGGGAGMVGAALLAARAALRMGAGKVFVDVLGAPEMRVDSTQPELMLQAGRIPKAGEVLVAGCGMGNAPAMMTRLAAWIAHEGPAVFDADALNALAGDAALREMLLRRTHPTVITPHPGEAARLLQTDTAAVQANRVDQALRLADALGAIVVLKGAGTVIADPTGAYAINPTGGPALASAGTGDVLAGMTGALLAQSDDPLAAVRAAVWLHGRAATLHGSDVGLVASEVAPLAARAWEQLRSQHTAPRPDRFTAGS